MKNIICTARAGEFGVGASLAASTSAEPTFRQLDSTALLGIKGEVEIAHQGETYRLRRTRQGKLILTK